ncbi:hypothetical protein FNP20_000613 [Enterococcus faecium]|uniref:hypothetical protein n=1 Tax=Enterococcus faecium TaxID=1352 RepID=UPI0011B0B84A|nr:hypothetical protein [Enterococcus faecium]EGP4807111.1 hypothetical protein [Enterococcus faecium]EGP4855155.1 hypothetical protein [Enterococcus faecium]
MENPLYIKSNFLGSLHCIGSDFFGSKAVSASELVVVDTSTLPSVSTIKINEDVFDAGPVELMNNVIIYDVSSDGSLTKPIKNFIPTIPLVEYNFTLGNGGWRSKSYQIGKVSCSYTTGRADGKVAQRLQYIQNTDIGSYAYYEEIDAGRAGISLTLPSAANYEFAMMSRMQSTLDYYARISF